MIETTFAAAIEAAIKARASIDPAAAEAIEQLEGKEIQINVSDQTFAMKFDSKGISVSASSIVEPNLTLTGSTASVSQALISGNFDNVAVVGDDALKTQIVALFRPHLHSSDLIDKGRATAEMGLSAVRSAFEGVVSQFAESASSQSSTNEFQDRLIALEETVAELSERIEDLEKS